jgi:lipopolysaccharide export LptBFGC system permease protein LptF
MVFVQKRVDDHRLEEVMISDRSDKDRAFHVFAETGEFSYDPISGLLRLTLENGDLRMEPNPSNDFEEYRISFSELGYHFSALKLGVGRLRYRMDQLGIDELREAVRRIESGDWGDDLKYRTARMYSTQIHRMLSMPFSSVLFVFAGVPLSLAGLVRSRAWGMLLALGQFAGCYAPYVYFQEIGRDARFRHTLRSGCPTQLC